MTQMASISPEHLPKKPRYQELFDALRLQIEGGSLPPGSQMPTFVELRAREGISRGTVEQVYMRLEREGLIRREQGRGTFVAPRSQSTTGQIGFVGTGFALRHRFPYAAQLVEGIESVLRREELRIVLLHDDSLSGWDKVDGIVMSSARPEETLKHLPPGFPCVSLLASAEGMPSVTADDYGGGKLGARELLALGHRRISCLMQSATANVRLRGLGFMDALQEAGIEVEPEWMRDPKIPFPAEGYRTWGQIGMTNWLRDGWRDLGCTAIFVQNDLGAMGVIDALREAELRVPEDVSVLSFDGTELCDYYSPRIASVQVPLYRIGATGMELVLSQIQRGKREDTNTVLPTQFKAGDSIAAPAAAYATAGV